MFHVDGVLFKDSFGTAEMREIFREEQFIQQFLEVEAALARAEARVGLVPEEAAAALTEKATLDHVDLAAVEENVAEKGLFTVAIIEAWRESFGEEGEYIHWGATSQDITDTAMVLQIREGYRALLDDLKEVRAALYALTKAHRDTPAIGRTHHVHAIPITFGLKTATWLDEVDRHVERLEALAERLFVVEFFGATGTLASLGEDGERVQAELADELDLSLPDVAWFASRDRFAELLGVLAQAATTLGKIANQILMLNRPEIGEVHEPIPAGEIGSSTMPHKRNPMRSETTVALARLVRANAAVMTELMDGYDERDFSTWLAEFAVVPETFLYASRITANTVTVLEDLAVDPDAMQRNLEHYGGLVASEAVMMRLAEDVGRQVAHEIVYENAMAAISGDRSFVDYLRADDRVTEHLSGEELERVTDATRYTGRSTALVDRVLARVEP